MSSHTTGEDQALKAATACALAFLALLAAVILLAILLLASQPNCGSSSATSGSLSANGFAYPLTEQGKRGGGVADHNARAFGNWMSDNAVDILVPENTPVVAVGDGVIYKQSGSARNPTANPAGYTLYLRSRGHEFSYMHLNSFTVREGQRVKQGQIIGRSGIANSVAHLHFAALGINPETITDQASPGSPGVGISTSGSGPSPTPLAKKEIPADYLTIYIAIGARYKIPWALLASIGRQESDHGRNPLSKVVNYAGCTGPMGICVGGMGGDTLGAYGHDGNRDGKIDVQDPWDAIATAANVLIKGKGVKKFPNGSVANYREGLCGYYGACGDSNADYANEVLERAEQYGGPDWASQSGAVSVDQCVDDSGASGPANLKKAVAVTSPQSRTNLPRRYGGVEIDARLVDNAIWAAQTYNLYFTQGLGGYPPSQSHGYGVALDIIPGQGGSWSRVEQFARDLGWTRECGASGLAKKHGGTCPLVPAVRFIGYDGYPNHGTGNHLHVSWDCSCGAYDGSLNPPPSKVWVFPSPASGAQR